MTKLMNDLERPWKRSGQSSSTGSKAGTESGRSRFGRVSERESGTSKAKGTVVGALSADKEIVYDAQTVKGERKLLKERQCGKPRALSRGR